MLSTIGKYLVGALIIAFWGSFLARHIDPNSGINIAFLGLLFPFLFILTLAACIILFVKKANLLGSVLAVSIALSIGSVRHFINWNNGKTIADEDETLTIMSYNTMSGVRMVNAKHMIDDEMQSRFDHIIRASPQPDIISLQETSKVVEEIMEPHAKTYPHKHKLQKRGAAIYSKYPFVQKGLVDFGPKLNSCLWADIALGADTIRIYSAHLESNRITTESLKMLTDQDYEKTKALNGLKDIFFKYNQYSYERASQASRIKKHSQKSKYPVVVAGDFNETPMSYTYDLMNKGLVDAYCRRGKGYGSTWAGRIPFLRIDYLLSDPRLPVQQYIKMNNLMSDHYPIKAVYTLD